MGQSLKLEQSAVSAIYARQVKLHPPSVLGEYPYAPRYALFLIQPDQRSRPLISITVQNKCIIHARSRPSTHPTRSPTHHLRSPSIWREASLRCYTAP